MNVKGKKVLASLEVTDQEVMILETWVLAFGSVMEIGEVGLRQVEQGFSSFFGQIFGIFDDISK